ncbi:MAG: host attachment protein [Parachlamydiaceae bacterium]|nr:host attachment protein [Parachlamydiaceae bacterium]
MSSTWVMVANSSIARFFEVEKSGSLKEIDTFVHPESRLHARDLVSDRPGRSFESASFARSALESRTNPKDVEEDKFARQISEHLHMAHQDGKFSRLYIAAGPRFLGLLRQFMTPTTAQLLTAEIDKDITHMPPLDIRKHLPY